VKGTSHACLYCETSLQDDWEFCPRCGLTSNDSAPVVLAIAPPPTGRQCPTCGRADVMHSTCPRCLGYVPPKSPPPPAVQEALITPFVLPLKRKERPRSAVAIVAAILILGGAAPAVAFSVHALRPKSRNVASKKNTDPPRAAVQAGSVPLLVATPIPTPKLDVVALADTRNEDLRAEIKAYLRERVGRVGVAVYDTKTRRTFTLNPTLRFNTGSIVKAQILGTLLKRAQSGGARLAAVESTTTSMIEHSDNNAASSLWRLVGGALAVRSFDRSIGMLDTSPNPGAWGLTTTTAPDNVLLVRNLALSSRVLTSVSRAYALHLMENVTPSQRWGVSGGVARGTTIAIKNGWLPRPTETRWIVNSIGWVHGHGRDYVIAVLSDRSPTQGYGIQTIEHISEMVWDRYSSAPQDEDAGRNGQAR
jgi:beta-lactamase class A